MLSLKKVADHANKQVNEEIFSTLNKIRKKEKQFGKHLNIQTSIHTIRSEFDQKSTRNPTY